MDEAPARRPTTARFLGLLLGFAAIVLGAGVLILLIAYPDASVRPDPQFAQAAPTTYQEELVAYNGQVLRAWLLAIGGVLVVGTGLLALTAPWAGMRRRDSLWFLIPLYGQLFFAPMALRRMAVPRIPAPAPAPAAAPGPPPRRGSPRLVPLILGVLILAALGYGAWRVVSIEGDVERLSESAESTFQRIEQDLDVLRSEIANLTGQVPPDVPSLVQQVSGSVVTVEVVGAGLGSGFAIEATPDIPAGYQSAVLTNLHVVREAIRRPETEIVVLQGTRRLPAELGETDMENDLAVVFVEEEIPPLPWAPDAGNEPQEGDFVVAIGSPFGLQGSSTVGVISKVLARLVQTDAAINPGNSGGPLLNRNGEVVGVNTFGVAGGENVNFAVRIERACDRIVTC